MTITRRKATGSEASSATLVGSVLILMGVALGLTAWLVDAQVPDVMLEWVQAHLHHQWQFLLALNIILLVLGSVLEMYSAIVVLAPAAMLPTLQTSAAPCREQT